MIKKSAFSKNEHQICMMITAFAVLLFIGFVAVSAKYVITKIKWHRYASQMLQSTDKQKVESAQEDAMMFATTVGQFPVNAPVYKQSKELQQYVTALSKQTGRDIVVLDVQKNILADTISAEIGKKFAEDKGNEVSRTIDDGKARSFMEKSTGYPQGISQTVVPLKDTAGVIVGAVIMSTSHTFE